MISGLREGYRSDSFRIYSPSNAKILIAFKVFEAWGLLHKIVRFEGVGTFYKQIMLYKTVE